IGRYEPDLESHWVYDTATTGKGQLAEAYTGTPTNKDYRRIHAYDSLGRPSLTTQYLSDGAYIHATEYDVWGRVITETYKRGNDEPKIFQARYNAYGYLAQWQRPATTAPTAIPARVLWRVIEQSAQQNPLEVGLGNGLRETRTYDTLANRLTMLELRTATTKPLNDNYLFDEIGNVTTRNVVWDTGGFGELFKYDNLNRLTESTIGSVTQFFEYDATGNMTRKTGVGGGTANTMVYPAQGPTAIRPHAITSVTGGTFGTGTYTYDANGNLATAPNGRTATWTSFDMPLTLTKGSNTATFTYGPEHQRTKQVRSGNITVTYAGAMEVETNTSTNTRTIKTYWPMGIGVEIDRPATGSPAVTPPNELNWLHKDRLGSPIAISGETGTLRERLAYDAWGKRRTTNGATTGTPATPTPDTIDGVVDNRGFTGHEMLDQLDLVHMNGRIYDPLIGRFLSADPILQDPMNGQSYNRYSYVMNNPTNLTDPTGFAACGASDTGSNIAQSCSAEQKATEKTIASGTYVMNNADGSRTAFVGGKVAMKTDGKGTVLFDAKAPQAASTAVPPQGSNDITTHSGPSLPQRATSLGLDFVPVAGTVKSGVELATGKDPITGESVNRWLAGVGVFAGIVGLKGYLKAGAVAAEGAVDVLRAEIALYRGARAGEEVPNFVPKPGEFKIDKITGNVKEERGLSLFNTREAVIEKGMNPHRVDLSSVPDSLKIIPQGRPGHFEVVPKPGANLTPQQYINACSSIVCTK
ncbi:MAG: RHS repeat-associated core domain-containing protein, partial [Burkholderiales bacterium]